MNTNVTKFCNVTHYSFQDKIPSGFDIFIAIIMVLWWICGAVGNVWLWVKMREFLQQNKQRAIRCGAVFLSNLSCANLVCLCVAFPGHWIWLEVHKKSLFNSVLISIIKCVRASSLQTSLYTVVILTIDRFLYLGLGDRVKGYRTKKNGIIICTLLWIVSTLFNAIIYGVEPDRPHIFDFTIVWMIVYANYKDEQHNSIYIEIIVCYLIPVFVVACCRCLLSLKNMVKRKNESILAGGSTKKRKKSFNDSKDDLCATMFMVPLFVYATIALHLLGVLSLKQNSWLSLSYIYFLITDNLSLYSYTGYVCFTYSYLSTGWLKNGNFLFLLSSRKADAKVDPSGDDCTTESTV